MIAAFLIFALAQTPAPSVRTVGKGPASGIDVARQITVRTAAEWAKIWADINPMEPSPAVDFSHEMVVGVFAGTRASAGYSIQIVRTIGHNGVLIVDYVESAPAPGTIAAQLLTTPYHLVAIPKHDGDVQFEKVKN